MPAVQDIRMSRDFLDNFTIKRCDKMEHFRHKHSAIEIGRHPEEHGLPKSALEERQLSILKTCRSKFDCLIFEMLFIKELRRVLKAQKDYMYLSEILTCKYLIFSNLWHHCYFEIP